MSEKLVIFDCDGVLIDSEIISAQMLREEIANYGINIELDHIFRHYVGHSFPTVCREIQRHFGISLPDHFERDYRVRLLDAFDRDLKIMPGVASVIEALAVPSCVATSSSPMRVARALDIVGLSSLFEGRIFTASEVQNGKPAPDLFLHSADQMGVHRNSALVIEDSEAGVAAGLAAGMKTIRFIGGSHLLGHPGQSNADMTFDNFDLFFEYFPHLKK